MEIKIYNKDIYKLSYLFIVLMGHNIYDGCPYSIYFLSLALIPKWLTRDIG